MKKSKTVSLTLLNGIIVSAMAACTGHNDVVGVDPCARVTFNQPACERAIAGHGYNYNGVFYPMLYPNPYSYYYGAYDSYRLSGGHVYIAPSAAYAPHYVPPATRANVFIQRNTAGGKIGVSSSRMGSAMRASGSSFSAGRSGATVGRGGFGSIGAGHSSFGG